ncbi:hypothetical protein [Butyrivibrio fibrisolvens]|uniref:hypothetical protein n=1 Tax=Butyrivibrio fibrisolvens TaxID=831 RepID=UPI000407D848|nr:hypothetical protein [Butyrivibrio fibrisolvens]
MDNIIDVKVSELKSELQIMKSDECKMTLTEKLEKVMHYAAQLAGLFDDRKLDRSTDDMILIECAAILDAQKDEDIGQMEDVVRGLKEISKSNEYGILSLDISKISEMVFSNNNPAHVGIGILEAIKAYQAQPVIPIDDNAYIKNKKLTFTTKIEKCQCTSKNDRVNTITDQRKNDDFFYILCPFGIGDTFYVCAFIEAYKAINNISKVCVIVKENHRAIPKWFKDVDSIIVSNELVESLKIFSIDKNMWKLDNYLYGHFKAYIQDGIMGFYEKFYSVYDFVSKYKKIVFELDDDANLSCPTFEKFDEDRAREYGVDNKTVILMPYASSVPALPEEFFEIIAKYLMMSGYNVITNVYKEGEEPLKNTRAICEDIATTVGLCENACAVISLRSGLCDVLAFSKVRLFVINTGSDIYNLSYVIQREGLKETDCTSLDKLNQVTSEIFTFMGLV